MLQCGAVRCTFGVVQRALRSVAYNTPDYMYVCCSVLQCVAVCSNVLQCVAVCCSVLQCVAVRC